MEKKSFRINRSRGLVLLACGIAVIIFSSCSVMSKDVRREAEPDIRFESLRRNIEVFEGKSVILGGYILETRNLQEETRILVLQSPLGIRDEPKSRDHSGGRFLLVQQGFLDPAIYQKGRKITVAGEVRGSETTRVNAYVHEIPVIRPAEIHLWEEQESPRYYYRDPFFYPWADPYFRYRSHPLWW